MTSNPHGPLMPWATRVIQWPVQRDAEPQGEANPIKAGPSSNRGLQLALVKPESLVTVGQPYHGEYVLGFCTRVLGSLPKSVR